MFLDDVQYFTDGSDEAVSLRLKWYTIAVSSKFFPFVIYSLIISTLVFNLVSKRKFSIVSIGSLTGSYPGGEVEKYGGRCREGEGFQGGIRGQLTG